MQKKISVAEYLSAHSALIHELDPEQIEKAVDMIAKAFKGGKKIITCGNGGSATTASHYITDWKKMIHLATRQNFYGFCLCDNIGLITAYANDISYDEVFSGQLDAMMEDGDLLVAISGSGNSKNVLNAVKAAQRKGGNTLAIVGYDGGELMPICDHSVWVRSFDMQLCEDMHLMIGHIVMKSLCGYGINR